MLSLAVAAIACRKSDVAAEIRRDVEASARALSERRYDDYVKYFSAACRNQIDRDALATVIDSIAQGFPGFKLTIREFKLWGHDGDTAEIAVTSVFVDSEGAQITSAEPRPQNSQVVREGDTWVTAECAGVLGSEQG